jgi:uncharacterized protein YdeI (YjbR/CyaY-like superfamily)
MGKRDPRVDAYIAKAADFAKPVLSHFRELVHAGCPDVEETIKWQFPHFMHHGILCSVAAFKAHCGVVFWKGALLFPDREKTGMGHFGRITAVSDLPEDRTLLGYVKEAARLNEAGIQRERTPARPKRKVVVPAYFQAALKGNPKARAAFAGFSPSHQREYVEWVVEAKREETRQKRLETALGQMTEGKSRHWKHETKCVTRDICASASARRRK